MTWLEMEQRIAELEDELISKKDELKTLKQLQSKLLRVMEDIKNSPITKPGTRLIVERALRGVFIIERDLMEG